MYALSEELYTYDDKRTFFKVINLIKRLDFDISTSSHIFIRDFQGTLVFELGERIKSVRFKRRILS